MALFPRAGTIAAPVPLTSRNTSRFLALCNYDVPVLSRLSSVAQLLGALAIEGAECATQFGSGPRLREIFERQIRYREYRCRSTNAASLRRRMRAR